MSSKPTNGINHKQYGVTSEGVAVYLDVGLRETGRHPAQTGRPFTVKLTGGTDGDVAGNMLRIMHERCVASSPLSSFGPSPASSTAGASTARESPADASLERSSADASQHMALVPLKDV